MPSEQERQAVEAELKHYPNRRAVCIDALKIVHAHRGWVSDQGIADVAEHAIDAHAACTEIDGTFYENEVPPFVESALETLYGNIYSSLAEWRLSGAIKDASTFVLCEDGKLKAVLLFRREKNRLVVLNEVVTINCDDVHHFARCVFAAFDEVTVITFRAIETDVQRLPFPFQRVNYSEDIVVPLPSTEAEYLASLGNATRKNLNRHRNRLMRDFPSFDCHVYEREEIREEHVRAIVKFNQERMARKNKSSGFDEHRTQRLISLAKTHGFAWVATIDGRVCAGALCFCIGPHYFMELSSHDYAYDEYRLGTLCCYRAICASIARGGSELHLLWGRNEYKYMLKGVQRNLDILVIYRDGMHLLRNGNLACKTAIQGYIRQMKLWVQRKMNQSGSIARAVINAADLFIAKRLGQ